MAKSKPMKFIFENSPDLERVARAYARLVEQQEGVTLKSVTWMDKRTGEVHVTQLRKEAV